MLPTGSHQELSANEQAMQGAGVYPFFESMDNHYTAVPQNGRNRMELTDEAEKVTLVYDVGTSYKQWMIWNNEATEGFFCPEPQINLVNAPIWICLPMKSDASVSSRTKSGKRPADCTSRRAGAKCRR